MNSTAPRGRDCSACRGDKVSPSKAQYRIRLRRDREGRRWRWSIRSSHRSALAIRINRRCEALRRDMEKLRRSPLAPPSTSSIRPRGARQSSNCAAPGSRPQPWPDIDMLAREVALPSVYLQQKTLDTRRFDDDFTHLSSPPVKPSHWTGPRLNRRHISPLSWGRHACDSRTTPRSHVHRPP
jgi:hypothetical protein